jgi:hypothetical protein
MAAEALGLWRHYRAVIAQAEEEWSEGDRPCEVTAIASATGLDPQELWDEVEGRRGWESLDMGYQGMVWLIAWEMKGFPDWEGVAPPPRAPAEAADDAWRAAHGG